MVAFSTQSYAQLATSPALGLQEQLWNLRVEIGCYRSNMDFSFGMGRGGTNRSGRCRQIGTQFSSVFNDGPYRGV